MINIAHPPVSTKPPLSRFEGGRVIERKAQHVGERKNEKSLKIVEKDDSVEWKMPSRDDATTPGLEKHVNRVNRANDCNDNLMKADTSSFQQLCNMINDLEANTSGTEENPIFYDKGDSVKSSLALDANTLSSKYLNEDQPEKDDSVKMGISSGSTYEDIMSFLASLEENPEIAELRVGKRNHRTEFRKMRQHPESLKEELATAQLQLEDREATIKLVKDELKNERKIACEKMEKTKREKSMELEAQKNKYQAVVKRHQKFIEQLIGEKKDLTDKCNALAQKIKESETKQERELKCLLERHAVELQRARQLCAASEKIRRERWLEAKTCKIKEMTVKGLEPELRAMVEQHQREIQDIRSSHIKELQQVELTTIRRSNRQLEQLRLELTASHDKIVSNEREALRVRFQEKIDEQEALIQAQQRKFFDELQAEKKRFAEEQARRDAERDLVVEQTSLQFHEKMEMLVRQHRMEKRTLEESLQAEREIAMENYRKQQNTKLEMTQARIIDECNRQRDKQIELAIAALEKETRDTKINLEKSWETKMRCTKEKYESELEEAKEQIELLGNKLSNAQEKLEAQERHIGQTEERLARCTLDLNQAQQTVKTVSVERDEAKKIARREIESEKRHLEEKIASLYRELTHNNANTDSVMAQLYSRIKLIITQKDLAIKNATREANDTRERCEHLEKLLDQQRKEYVLKSL